jgi:CSLREA domain-containing protein
MKAIVRAGLLIAAFAAVVAPATAAAETINVDIRTDEFNNDGECSLREAVEAANLDNAGTQTEDGCETGTPGSSDTVDLPGGAPYTLTTAVVNNDIMTGDLEVTDADGTTFLGDGSGSSVIDGGGQDRILDISAASGAVTVNGLTVQNGEPPTGNGGGILTMADLTLENARVTDNQSGGTGGGVIATQMATLLTLNSSTIDLNTAVSSGGGVNLSEADLVASGDSHIDDNDALAGGGINGANGDADITLNPGVTVDDNNVTATGGGIAHNSGNSDVDLVLDQVAMSGNDATSSTQARGGAIYFVGLGSVEITDSRLQNNTIQGVQASGGAIHAGMSGGSPISIDRSLLSGNSVTVVDDATVATDHGGGALSTPVAAMGTGLVNVTNSRFLGNTVTMNDPQDFAIGGAISSKGQLTVDSTTFDDNGTAGTPQSSQGGAINVLQPSGPTGIINSTFSGNHLVDAPLDNNDSGGAVWVFKSAAAPVTVAHSTFTGNVSPDAASALTVNGGADTNYTVRGSIFAENDPSACVPGGFAGNLAAPDHNVDTGNSCGADLANQVVQLGSLAANGGPIAGNGPALTHYLTGPPAVLGLVPGASCLDLDANPLLVDQRGAPRQTGGTCEPGAVELISCDAVPAFTGSAGDDTISTVSFGAHNAFHTLGGADTVTGDADANQLCGGDDGDDLTGGAGADSLSGDGGDDDIFARDGVADTISCGAGTDTVETDAQGVDTIAGDCETVNFLAPPGGGNPPQTPPTTTPPATTPTPKCKKGQKLKKGKCVKKKKRKKRK